MTTPGCVNPSILRFAAVMAGRAGVTAMTVGPLILKAIVQFVQTPLFASRMACRSEPLPDDALVVTISVPAPITVPVTDALLLLVFGSVSVAVTDAGTVNVPPAEVFALTDTVAEVADERVAIVHVTVDVPVQVAPVAVEKL